MIKAARATLNQKLPHTATHSQGQASLALCARAYLHATVGDSVRDLRLTDSRTAPAPVPLTFMLPAQADLCPQGSGGWRQKAAHPA